MTISQEVIDTLQELKRMHQLNMEILEQLAVTCNFLTSSHIQIPNSNTLASLLTKAMSLLDELQSEEPKTVYYQKLTDESSHEPQNRRRLHRTQKQVLVTPWAMNLPVNFRVMISLFERRLLIVG